MKKVRKAVIPVGGLGTRFLPGTKAVPKEMFPVVDKPTIQYIVEECAQSGIEEILFITSGTKKAIEDHFDINYNLEYKLAQGGKTDALNMIRAISYLTKIRYILDDQTSGSGAAIALAKSFVGDEPFAVLYGDDLMMYDEVPVLKQLINDYEKTNGANIIAVQKVNPEDVNKYGIVEYENGNKIKRLIEKPKKEEAPSLDAGLGRYIVNSTIFAELEDLQIGVGGEYQFADAMLKLMDKEPFYACRFKGTYYDTGSKLGYIKANIDFALNRTDLKKDLKEYLKQKQDL